MCAVLHFDISSNLCQIVVENYKNLSTLWWDYETETLYALLALCARKPLVTGGFPLQRPEMCSFMLCILLAWTSCWTNSWCTSQLTRDNAHATPLWCNCIWINSTRKELTHWGRDKMATIFQTTFSNAFSWMKIVVFLSKFHWNLFSRVRLTISQHWFR